MLGFLTDIGFGAITGLIGTITTTVANYKMQKLKNEHEVAMERETRLTISAETAASVKIEETRLASEIEKSEARGYAMSQETGAKRLFSDSYMDKLFTIKPEWLRLATMPLGVTLMAGFGFIDFLKGLMRPGLTTYYALVNGYLTYLLWGMPTIGALHMLQNGSQLFSDLVSAFVYLNISCVTWWFGDRQTSKFLMRLNDGNAKF